MGKPGDNRRDLEAQSAMAENGKVRKQWRFGANPKLLDASSRSIKGTLDRLFSAVDPSDERPLIPLGHGDPSSFPSFRTSPAAEDAIISAVRSGNHNGYRSAVNYQPAKRAVAEYLSRDLPYRLSPDDVLITNGCCYAIEAVVAVLSRPGASILLPRTGYPFYDVRAAFSGLEVRYFDLVQERGWEIDLDSVERLADEGTAAMVIINPGNPTGSVLSYSHLEKVAETARKLGIMIISDEVYGHLVFGSKPFVPMGVFGSIAPVLTLGSISKRWSVPGWRLGWIAVCDRHDILKEAKIVDNIKDFLSIGSDPVSFVQGAVPEIIKNTSKDFFENMVSLLRQTMNMCFDAVNEISCFDCQYKPEGALFMMVKLDWTFLGDINDDVEFCLKLAMEESVIILPGSAVGMPNWVRITFAVEPAALKEGIQRLNAFCKRHAKQEI
ncbi:tyrosine transaminase family protein [Wolffia australiana]